MQEFNWPSPEYVAWLERAFVGTGPFNTVGQIGARLVDTALYHHADDRAPHVVLMCLALLANNVPYEIELTQEEQTAFAAVLEATRWTLLCDDCMAKAKRSHT